MRTSNKAYYYSGRGAEPGRIGRFSANGRPLPSVGNTPLLCGSVVRSRRAQLDCAPAGAEHNPAHGVRNHLYVGADWGYPTLLKLVCHWWLMTHNKPPPAQWLPTLRAETTVQKRLADIGGALTPAEQQFLSALPKSPASAEHGATTPCQPDRAELTTLLDKGLCFQEGENVRIFSGLFADYVAKIGA